MRGRKELIEQYDAAQSSFTIKHREETRNIKTYFITGRKPGNLGIPGLDTLADERPEHLLIEKLHKETLDNATGACSDTKLEANKDLPNDVENASAAAADLFSQRIPDIMTDIDVVDNLDKAVDELGRNVQQGVSQFWLKNTKLRKGNGNSRQPPTASPICSHLNPSTTINGNNNSVTLTSYKYLSMPVGLQGGSNENRGPCRESGADSTLLKQIRSGSVTEDQDRLLISLIAKEVENNKTFFKPTLNKLWLTFDSQLENMYRHEYKDSHLFQENMLASPRYQTAVEAAIALVVLLILAVCCHIMFHPACTTGLVVVTVLGLLVEIVVFLDALSNIIFLEDKKSQCPSLLNITLSWYFRNALGVAVATLPSLLVYISFSCDLVDSGDWKDRLFCFIIVVSLLQYCNYTMLRSIAKTIMAILVGSILIVLLFLNICSLSSNDLLIASMPDTTSLSSISTNWTNNSSGINKDHLFSGENPLRFEIILSTLLLLLLIFILNYEFENSYRLSFYASVKAQKDKENMQLNKDQADWLLHNIIPAHLAELFKTNRSYSRNHQDVGVVFATIVNFNEFYDEMYEGGREYLRVLNELVSDYEVMLSDPRFKDVEKIKTISSSFMAAAGLNEESRAQNKHPYAHLFALMDFAIELEEVVARFNESIFNFSFILNIGYNYGPVTAGVIGTTKLLYDIWGDTVNIASRMYSTGEDNRIQVPQATAEMLSEMFEFSYRDEIAVKGKGVMKTYLLEKKKEDARWE